MNNDILSNEDLNSIVEEAAKNADDNDDITRVREISKEAMEYVPEEELPSRTEEFQVGLDGKPMYAKPGEHTLNETDLDLMEAINGGLEKENEERFANNVENNIKSNFNLSDEDANKLLDCLMTYKRDQNVNIYKMLPSSIRATIDNICAENDIGILERNNVAKMFITEFISEAETDKAFIDFEKALDRAMRIPSVVDMYNSHLEDTIDKKLPIMADAIEKEDPEKAKMLREVAERFNWSITYSDMLKQYDESSAIRKAVRKKYKDWVKHAELVNFINKDTDFKMPDACSVGDILFNAIIKDTDNDITEEEIAKFLTLLYKSIDKYRENTVVNASYIYYLLKNIMMISYTNEKTKTSFSGELIGNIKMVIYYIRSKEAANNAINNKA